VDIDIYIWEDESALKLKVGVPAAHRLYYTAHADDPHPYVPVVGDTISLHNEYDEDSPMTVHGVVQSRHFIEYPYPKNAVLRVDCVRVF